jgi:hypothetical protein
MIRDFALIENDVVTNVIVVDDQNAQTFSAAIGKELISTNEIPLTIGDYRRDGKWYRIVNGTETCLTEPLIEPLTEPIVEPTK